MNYKLAHSFTHLYQEKESYQYSHQGSFKEEDICNIRIYFNLDFS